MVYMSKEGHRKDRLKCPNDKSYKKNEKSSLKTQGMKINGIKIIEFVFVHFKKAIE